MRLYGRRKIYTDKTEVTEQNIVEVLSDALRYHRANVDEIRYLRKYVKGNQPILERTKKVRKDVQNNVVMNLAQECLDFKLGYVWGEPIGIVRRSGSDANVGVDEFNAMLDEQGKNDNDQGLAKDLCVTGIAYRAILPNPDDGDESPFMMAKLDPETTFCVYSNDVFSKKLLGVSYCIHDDGTVTYSAYTNTTRYELCTDVSLSGVRLVDVSPNGMGVIPIVEYNAPDNSAIFERAIPLMDAINVLTSNRLDDIEQFVASILWIHNADMSDDDLKRLDELLAVRTKSSGDGQQATLKYLNTTLDQSTVQDLQKSLEEHVYELCGVPGRSQSSGGSTGEAASLGEAGWKKIEFQAKRIESAWKKGERGMLKVILSIFDKSSSIPAEVKALRIQDFEIKFVRSKTNNLLTKTQGMMNMLNAGIHPRIAIKESDLFSDPEQVYADSKPYIDMALERLNGKNAGIMEKQTGDVSNQPKGDSSMNAAAQAMSTIQKRD